MTLKSKKILVSLISALTLAVPAMLVSTTVLAESHFRDITPSTSKPSPPVIGNCDGSTAAKNDQCLKSNPIVRNLNNIVTVLSGLVGVVVVGTIILGGIQYAMAGDKAEAGSAANPRITNGLIALLAFLFIFAFLQWLIPGGVFK